MASKLTQALNISLDDYIAKKGIVSSLRTKSVNASEADYFKRPTRSDDEDDDNTDLFFEDRNGMEVEPPNDVEDMPPLVRAVDTNEQMKEKTDELGEKRPANVSIQLDNDRKSRTFITEEKKRGIRHMPSQQWRLRRENQVSKKPTGVPPLVSVKTIFDRNTDELIASLRQNAKFQNDNARNRMNHRLQNNNGGRQWNNNRNRNFSPYNRNQGFQNRNQRNNNNRNQYGKNPNMAPSFNPTVDRFEQRNGTQMDKNQITDLRSFITPPSTLQSQAAAASVMPSGYYNSSNQMTQPQLVTFADMLNQIGRVADNQNKEMFASAIRNAMCNPQQAATSVVPVMTPESVSRMNPTELMPFAAQTLLNHISTVQQNFGPKYDMKVQKEIHALQGKDLLYRANGVVSMDGSGIDDDRVKPVTTDLSMNMRFS